MARRGQHSFLKRQKEIKRKEVAAEKMARRHDKGRKDSSTEIDDETAAFSDQEDSKRASEQI